MKPRPSAFFRTLAGVLVIALAGALCVHTGSLQNAAGGGGTETVIGKIVNTDGTAAGPTEVVLLPSGYDPFAVPAGDADARGIDTTGDSGSYAFGGLRPGVYTLTAKSLGDKTRALDAGIIVDKGVAAVLVDTLRKPGTVKVTLPAGADPLNGYMFVPGTDIAAMIGASTGTVALDSVPAGNIPVVQYAVKNTIRQDTIRCNVGVTPADTVTIVNPGWKFTRNLILNTTASGAQVASNVLHFPVLIRLTKSTFNFSQAQASGADLRFAKADNTQLPYEIERWDSVQGLAEAWVRVDTVFGNDSTHAIAMYWGASTGSATVSLSNGAAVFDTSIGFEAVWHLSENGGAITYDATVNHYDGMPKNMTAASAVAGMIGIAKEFNGASSYIQMPGTAYSTLDFPQRGAYSVSAWAYTDTLDTTTYRMIVSKGDYQYSLEVMNNRSWEFAENEDVLGWDVTNSPATAKKWSLIVGVRNGMSQSLYVDGVCVDTSIQTLFPGTTRYTGFDLMIGKKVNSPDYFFSGMIDEVRISSVALSADWIKLCYMNQKETDALVRMK